MMFSGNENGAGASCLVIDRTRHAAETLGYATPGQQEWPRNRNPFCTETWGIFSRH